MLAPVQQKRHFTLRQECERKMFTSQLDRCKAICLMPRNELEKMQSVSNLKLGAYKKRRQSDLHWMHKLFSNPIHQLVM